VNPITLTANSATPVAPFVDWLSLFQTIPEGTKIPVVGGGRNIRSDMDMTELESESVRFLRHEGSHDTAVFVRSDGHSMAQWGNPGRYGRPDNLFSLDWPDTLAAAGKINAMRGLPEFTAGDHFVRPVKTERDARLGLFDAWTGARVSEIHLTKNYAAGSDGMARQIIHHWRGLRAARLSKGVLGATTIVFGSHAKGGRQVEVYLKADEMLAHVRGEAAKDAMRQSKAYQWARDVGLIRVELKMRRMALRDAGMNYAGGINMGKIIRIFDKHTAFLLDATPERAARVVDNLPAKSRAIAMLWIQGADVAALVSRATFYRHAKVLREYGMDIAEPRGRNDEAERELQRHLDNLPDYRLRELNAPEWYDAASEWGGHGYAERIAA
jgi:hypothetical protein